MSRYMHSLFIHKMGLSFFTSYAQQIQRQTGSKPQTKFLHQSNPASHFKMPPPPPKKQPFVCSPVSHSDRSFYSNLILAEWHKPRSEYFHVLTDTHFPFKQIALSSLKLLQQDYRLKNTKNTRDD